MLRQITAKKAVINLRVIQPSTFLKLAKNALKVAKIPPTTKVTLSPKLSIIPIETILNKEIKLEEIINL